jgi:hypothetical protein
LCERSSAPAVVVVLGDLLIVLAHIGGTASQPIKVLTRLFSLKAL